MKITDMLVSAIIKRGIVYEGRNVDINVDIPIPASDSKPETTVRINFKSEHMTLKIEKEEV